MRTKQEREPGAALGRIVRYQRIPHSLLPLRGCPQAHRRIHRESKQAPSLPQHQMSGESTQLQTCDRFRVPETGWQLAVQGTIFRSL